MSESEFISWMSQLIKDWGGTRAITGPILQNVLTTFAQNVLWKDTMPFDYHSVSIENSNLTDYEYTHNHNLNCDEPVYVISWVDGTLINGDEYFEIQDIDSNNKKFVFLDDIPTGTVTITALKFKTAS